MNAVCVLALLLLAGCRTQPYETPAEAVDLSVRADLADLADLAQHADLSSPADLGGRRACGFNQQTGAMQSCDRKTELCVFIDRGDCAQWLCEPLPPKCRNDRSCACLGPSACVATWPMETLTCAPPTGLDAELDCKSSTQCVD